MGAISGDSAGPPPTGCRNTRMNESARGGAAPTEQAQRRRRVREDGRPSVDSSHRHLCRRGSVLSLPFELGLEQVLAGAGVLFLAWLAARRRWACDTDIIPVSAAYGISVGVLAAGVRTQRVDAPAVPEDARPAMHAGSGEPVTGRHCIARRCSAVLQGQRVPSGALTGLPPPILALLFAQSGRPCRVAALRRDQSYLRTRETSRP